MRVQNLIAAAIFGLVFSAYVGMQLLNYFPSSAVLWQFNIVFAREARPLFDMFDILPFARSAFALLTMLGLIGLCWLAVHKRNNMMTAATTHAALYVAVYSCIASYAANLDTQSLASIDGIIQVTAALRPKDQVLTAMALVLAITCLTNHMHIVSELARDLLARKNKFSANSN